MNYKEASVYWIRLPEHTDPLKEGYVGVSKNWKRRVSDHMDGVINECHPNPHLINAAKKYGMENFITDEILSGDETFCYQIEAEFRPSRGIGWNISPGGHRGPGRNKGSPGKKRTPKEQAEIDEQRRIESQKKLDARLEIERAREVVAEQRRIEAARNKKVADARHLRKSQLISSLMEELQTKNRAMGIERSKLSSNDNTIRHNAGMEMIVISNYIERLLHRLGKLKKEGRGSA